MKVELKQIIEQLTEAVGLDDGFKVSACIDNGDIVGWCIVRVDDDGSIHPTDKKIRKTVKELLDEFQQKMTHEELDRNRKIFASINNLNIDDVHPIPKSELEVGKSYRGECRNSDVATWDGKVFWHGRYKFGSTFKESINHYEDNDGYDVFVPFEKVNEWTNTMTEQEYFDVVKTMYPKMPDNEILEHMRKTARDVNGNIVRGEDMFDFSGALKGKPGTPGKMWNN